MYYDCLNTFERDVERGLIDGGNSVGSYSNPRLPFY